MTATTARRPVKAGIYAPIPTFFHADTEDLDIETFVKHVVRLALAGVPPVIAGSMGEAHHLTTEERITLVKAARKALDAAGLATTPIIAGSGLAGTRLTIELTSQLADAGADVAIVLSSGYFVGSLGKKAQKQLFTDVADASPIPVLIYNFPGATGGLDIESDVISELAKHPNIIGVKLTCGNVGKLTRIASYVAAPGFAKSFPRKSELVEGEDPFVVFGGFADFIVPSIAVKGHGAIIGLANLAPLTALRTYQLGLKAITEPAAPGAAELLAEAQVLQGIVAHADRTIALTGIPGTKFLLQKTVGYGGEARRPLLPIEAEAGAALLAHPDVVALLQAEASLSKPKVVNGV